MSATLGMPSATPSNATGRSGISADQVGHIGQGILGTIEEGVGGPSSRSLYYGTGSAFYQAPSMQRSYGDDIRSFNVKTFGSRGMVNLARRWFSQRSEIYMTYPIKYAWAGPEYALRVQPKALLANTIRILGQPAGTTGIPTAPNAADGYYGALLGECATEVRGGPNILPTYFWSGGAGFAMLSMIELNMGGGGNIIFDRYTNFAMIMASCPTISMRQDIMRMAGGGLYYDHSTDYKTLPVKFGWVPALTDEGTGVNRDAANTSTQDNGENMNFIWAPVEWQMSVPIKTPETNFWNALLSRKPIDTSCFASDLQYIITLGNFFEFSDTGVGLANFPYYIPPLGIAVSPAAVAKDVIEIVPYWHPQQNNGEHPSTLAAGVYGNTTQDRWMVYTKPTGTPLGATDGLGVGLYTGAAGTPAGGPSHCWPVPALLPAGYFYTGFSPQQEYAMGAALKAVNDPILFSSDFPTALAAAGGSTLAYSVAKFVPRSRVAAAPYIWGNHYRVCGGFMYGGYNKPRPRMAVAGSGTPETDNRYKLDVMSVHSGNPTPITYQQSLTQMEVRNHSYKLTNPALSAQQALKVDPNGSLYYPFQYGFSQTYRVPPSANPWDSINFHRWTSNSALISNTSASGQSLQSVFNDVTGIGNKITQNIIMPANPCTSMIVGIYREKDRRHLGMNTQGSYSPVLFWNALNPARCTLYDGGNILFDYQSSCAFENYSILDRPDVFRIPFRGGLCQLDPKNIYGSPYDKAAGVSVREGAYPNGFNQIANLPRRYQQGLFGGGSSDGKRFHPLHSTEWYNCHLLEFPFVVHEPLAREGTVQSTPSFAKTILRLEFYIDSLLKPHRGLDDMYDQTTMVPPMWFCGEYDYVESGGKSYSTGAAGTGNVLPYGPLSFSNTTVATANVALSVPNCHIADSVMNFNAYADDREQVVQSTRATNKITNSYFTMSPSASSWNINDGGLMIVVHFLQNQVWCISPLRTSILSSRG